MTDRVVQYFNHAMVFFFFFFWSTQNPEVVLHFCDIIQFLYVMPRSFASKISQNNKPIKTEFSESHFLKKSTEVQIFLHKDRN